MLFFFLGKHNTLFILFCVIIGYIVWSCFYREYEISKTHSKIRPHSPHSPQLNRVDLATTVEMNNFLLIESIPPKNNESASLDADDAPIKDQGPVDAENKTDSLNTENKSK